MAKEDVDVYARLEEAFKRIYALEDKIKSMDKHGIEHQIGGADEMVITRGLKFIAGDPDDVKKSGAAFFRNATVPNLEAWLKMIQTGDVYLNIPHVNNEFVLRYNDANYKVRLGHDGLIFRLTADNITGAYLLPGASTNTVVNLGTNTDTTHFEIPGAGGYRRKGIYMPSYWRQVFSAAGPVGIQTMTQNTWTSLTGISGSITTYGRDLWIFVCGSCYRTDVTDYVKFRLFLDGTSDYYFVTSAGTPNSAPVSTGAVAGTRAYFALVGKLTGVAAGTYTVKPQLHDNNVLSVKINDGDYWTCIIAEE